MQRNPGWSKPPIPYILKRDVVQELLAVDNATNTMNLTLPGKVELRVSVWSHGIPEQFIMHVKIALDVVRQKGLDVAYNKACMDVKECNKELHKNIKDQKRSHLRRSQHRWLSKLP